MYKMLVSLIMVINIILLFVQTKAEYRNIIVIDAGHGGMDTGASRGDIYESEVTLEIAKRLENIFEINGYNVVMTRNDMNALCEDKFIKKEDMNNRINIINSSKALFGLSIHLNEFGIEKYRGAQVFYSNANTKNCKLASSIQNSIRYYLNNTERSIVKRDNIFLLNKVSIPFCIVECGFMSNEEEFRLLLNADYQIKLAYAIFYGAISSI